MFPESCFPSHWILGPALWLPILFLKLLSLKPQGTPLAFHPVDTLPSSFPLTSWQRDHLVRLLETPSTLALRMLPFLVLRLPLQHWFLTPLLALLRPPGLGSSGPGPALFSPPPTRGLSPVSTCVVPKSLTPAQLSLLTPTPIYPAALNIPVEVPPPRTGIPTLNARLFPPTLSRSATTPGAPALLSLPSLHSAYRTSHQMLSTSPLNDSAIPPLSIPIGMPRLGHPSPPSGLWPPI